MHAPTPPRVVIDTNVWLDLLVYRDPGSETLMQDLRRRAWQAVSRPDCREEWLRVLHYPQFRVDAQQYREVVDAYDALCLALPQPPGPDAAGLPICRDPDDQKFLQLAQQSAARALVSKDRALLKLARRTRRAGQFAILPPRDWPVQTAAVISGRERPAAQATKSAS